METALKKKTKKATDGETPFHPKGEPEDASGNAPIILHSPFIPQAF